VLEFAFSPTLTEALNLVRGVVTETETGFGAALYVYDLDTAAGGSAVSSASARSDSKR
jgi:hypothetical protein